MSSVNNLPVNSKGQQFSAQLEVKTQKYTKHDDILVFSRIGDIKTEGQDKTGSKGGFFKASSNGFFKNFFKYKANAKDVIDIFQTAGMSKDEALKALKYVKESSVARKLSGLSADVVQKQLTNFAIQQHAVSKNS
jgi:hypothetical protein